jgi:hypothetical protein
MISNKAYQAVLDLDLAPIKVKLMHRASGEGWSLEKTEAVEIEYRRFLYLMKAYPDEQTVPLAEVDTFWHYHILDTLKYAADCAQAFGYFLHHYPYVGMGGEDDDEAAHGRAAARMRELYETSFGEPYGRAAPDTAFCGATQAASAFCGVIQQQAAFCGATTSRASFCGARKSARRRPTLPRR